MPDNQAELLTLQSRRLLLERDKGTVKGYRLLGGDFFPKINAIAEQMTMWDRRNGKKNEPPYDQPKRLNPDRKMWRDFCVITGAREECRAPGVVIWITTLQNGKALERNRIIRFRTAGVQYGDKDFFVEDILSDHLDFHTELLEEAGKLWMGTIQSQIEKTEKAAWLLGKFAEKIFKAEGGQPDGNAQEARKHQAEQNYYTAVDLPFRAWLCSIDPQLGDDEDQRRGMQNRWGREACQIALKQGQQMVRDAGTGAYTGRWIGTELYSSCQAFNQLKQGIYRCFDIPLYKKEAADE
jgi:CRISPR system Cascade subunit CasA